MPFKDPKAKAAWTKQYNENNRDKISAYYKQYYKDNHKKIKTQKKQYDKDNRDRISIQKKQYYKDNRDELLIEKKQYYKDNRGTILQQRKNHPEVGLRAQKKLYKKMGLTPYQTMAWARVIRKGKNCSYCGSDKDLHSHHLFTKARYPGLALGENNGIPLCVTCHREHHALNGVTA